MKKALTILLTLALVLPLCFSAFAADGEAAATPQVYYDQDFDGVTNASTLGYAWDTNPGNKGTYSVEDGKLIVDNTTGTGEASLVLYTAPAGTTLTNFKLSYDYTILTGSGTLYAGIMAYYKDIQNYIGTWIRFNGNLNLEERKNNSYKGTAGGWNYCNLGEKAGMQTGLNVTYHIEMTFVENEVSLKVNGYSAASGTTTLDQTGKIAIYTKNAFKSSYDNIKLEEVIKGEEPDSYRPDQGDTLPRAALVATDNITVDGERGADEGWTEAPTLTTAGLDPFNNKYSLASSSLKTWLATDGLSLYVFMEADTAKVHLLEMLVDFANTFDTSETKLTAADYDALLDTEDNGGNKSLWLQIDETGSSGKSWGYYEPRTVRKNASNKYGWSYLTGENSEWVCTGDDTSGKHTMEFKLPLGAAAASALQSGDYTIGYESVALDKDWQAAIATQELVDNDWRFAALRLVVLPCAKGNVTLPAIESIPADIFRTPTKAGAQLNPFANISDDAAFSVVGDMVKWTDADGKAATKAEAGKTYTATVTLLSKDAGTIFDAERTTIPTNYTASISDDGSTVTLTQTFTVPSESTTTDATTTEETPSGTDAPTEEPSDGCASSLAIAPLAVTALLGCALPLLRRKHED